MGPLALWRLISSPLGRNVVLALAMIGAIMWVSHEGYERGVRVTEARHQAEIAKIQIEVDSATAITRRQASELESYRDAARMLAMETDNEILADGNACVPTPDELRRAKRRWAGSD